MPNQEGELSEQDIDLKSVPVRVERIHVDGLGRTYNDIVVYHANDIFKATNFEEMVKSAQRARLKFEQLGLFKQIGILIDTSNGVGARSDGYEITYYVVEPRRLAGGANTLIGTNEGSLLLTARMPNALGRGERFAAEYSVSSKQAVGYSFTAIKPIPTNPNIVLQTGLFQYSGEYPWSNYKELDRGVSADITFPTVLGSHSLRWEGIWRDLRCLSPTTAFAVREQSGHSLKSSLKHIWVRERRDDRILPRQGYSVSLSQELAGFLGGNARFVKHEGEIQINQPLPLDMVLQLSLAGGLMRPLADSTIRINDKFFLGGPLTLRGFNIKGVGPHQDGSALGADTYWQAGVHLYSPLPFRPGKGGFGELFRTHAFLNAGNLANINTREKSLSENWRQLVDMMRVSYGAGVVLKLGGIARLEVNYCVPVRVQSGDSVNHGLQFGVGLNFL